MMHMIFSTIFGLIRSVFRNKNLLCVINTFVHKISQIKSRRKYHLKSQMDVLMFFYRSWVICHWRCWRQYWYRRSWCCMWLTRLSVLSVKHLFCWPLSTVTGGTQWLAGRNPQLAAGSVTNLRSGLNVSVHSRRKTLLITPPLNISNEKEYKYMW